MSELRWGNYRVGNVRSMGGKGAGERGGGKGRGKVTFERLRIND